MTRRYQYHTWMGPSYQNNHSDTPGRKLPRLVKRHHEYSWEKSSKRKRDVISRGKIKPLRLYNTPRPKILNRIRKTNDQAIKLGQPMTMNSVTRDGYKIWMHLIKRENEEISMNNIVDILTTNICISDS